MAIKRRGRPPREKATEVIIKKKRGPKRSTEILEKRRTLKFTDLNPVQEVSKQAGSHSDEQKINHWYPKNKLNKDDKDTDGLKEILEKVKQTEPEGSKYPPDTIIRNTGKIIVAHDTQAPIKKQENIKSPNEPPFGEGNTKGPGRPKGARNKMTMVLELIGEENAPAIYAKVVEMALAGDPTCVKLMMERINPIQKSRKINIEFNGPIDTIQDLNEVSKHVTRMAFDGGITFEEAEECGKIIERRLKVITDAVEVERINANIKKIDMIRSCI